MEQLLNKMLLPIALVCVACGGASGPVEEKGSDADRDRPQRIDPHAVMSDSGPPRDMAALLVEYGDLSLTLNALQVTGLLDSLRGGGPFTLFAPNNAAFTALPEGSLGQLMEPTMREELQAIMLNHLVKDALGSRAMKDGMQLSTAGGHRLEISLKEGLKVSGAALVMGDMQATNGVLHVVDRVLLPPADS